MFKKLIYTWLHHQFWNTTLPYFWRQTRRAIEERSSTESKLTRTNAPTPFLEHDHHHRTQMRCFEDLPTSKQNTNFLFSQIAACVHTHYLPNGTSRRKPVLYKNPKRSSEYERKKFEREIGKKKKPPVFQYYLKQKTGSLVLPGSLNPTGKQAGRKQHLPLEPRRRKLSHSTSSRNDWQPVWMFTIDGQDLVLCRRFLIYVF